MQTTRVVLTGTGTPVPEPGRAGAGVLIRSGDVALQFDAGRATALRLAEAEVACSDLDAVFLTHHHSDHVSGLADIVFARWIQTPDDLLAVVAPAGPLDEFGAQFLDPWARDLEVRRLHSGRTNDPRPRWTSFPAAARPHVVWERGDVVVSSVTVRHEPVLPAVGYRIETPQGAVVVSGDTRVCDEVEELSQGVDVLVHEVVSSAEVKDYVREYHADAINLGAMAARASVKTLVLTHLQPAPRSAEDEQRFVDEIRFGGFTGGVVVGRDLHSMELNGHSTD